MPGTLPEEMRAELAQIESEFSPMTPGQRRGKLIRWTIRQMLTVILYYFLWDAYPWVPKSLWVVVPLALLSLVTILASDWLIQRKFRKARAGIDKMEKAFGCTTEAARDSSDAG